MMFWYKACPALLLFLLSTSWANAWQTDSNPKDSKRSRKPFLENLKKIQPGMSPVEVENLLGKPDAKKTRQNRPSAPDGLLDESKESEPETVWIYGNDHPLLTPSLGSVSFGNNKVIDHKRSKLSQTAFDLQRKKELESIGEDKAEIILQGIYETAKQNHNPAKLIQITNALYSLGKENSIVILELFDGLLPPRNFTDVHYLIPRILFDVPEDPGYLPGMLIGASLTVPNSGIKELPRFPIILIDDVPLELYGPFFILAGVRQTFPDYIKDFREKGIFRKLPLRPKGNPMALMDQFEQTAGFLFPEKKSFEVNNFNPTIAFERLVIMIQIESFIKPVYIIPEKYKSVNNMTREQFYKNWESISQDFSRVRYKWDAEKSSLTFLDGSTLPTK